MKRFIIMLVIYGLMITSTVYGHNGTHTSEQKYEELQQKGIFSGYKDGEAMLDQEMTRVELAVIVTKLFALEEETENEGFADSRGHWGESYMKAVQEAGLMSGYNGMFEPDKQVTIEEMLSVIVRGLNEEGISEQSGDGESYVSEGELSKWAEEDVAEAVNLGLLDQTLNSTGADFDGTRSATREMLVHAAYAADARLVENEIRKRLADL